MKVNYTSKWILQRITAIFLIPLSFWFIYNCISFQKYQYLDLKLFFKSFTNSFLFLLMMVSMLIHAKLGCDTIVKDYVSSSNSNKFFKILINFITYLSLFLVIIAIIKMNIF